MDNALVVFLWVFCIFLGLFVLTVDRKINRLTERVENMEATHVFLLDNIKAEKTVENITDGVEV